MLAFERAIASRYFALGAKRTSRSFVWAFLVLLVALVTRLLHAYATRGRGPLALKLSHTIGPMLPLASVIAIALTILVAVWSLYHYRLNIFTAISVYGLFLGSAALVIVLSVMSGFEGDLKRKILGTNADVVVTRPDKPFTDYVAVREKLAHVPGVVAATPALLNEIMITSPTSEAGVIIKGIDPATVGQVTDLAKNIDAGDLGYLEHPEKLLGLGGPAFLHDEDDFPGDLHKPSKPALGDKAKPEVESDAAQREPPPPDAKDTGKATSDGAKREAPRDSKDAGKATKDAGKGKAVDVWGKAGDERDLPALPPRRKVPGIVLGRELARSLRVFLGDDVNIISPFGGIGPSGPMPKSKPYRVAGIFYSGMYEYDNKYTYVALPDAQKFFAMEGEVTGIELKVADPDRSEDVLPGIRALVGPSYEVQDWKQLNKSLFSALKIEKILMFVLLCFIILVAAFSIIANGTMLVMEKGREVAILKAMGSSDGQILTAFMLLGLYIGFLGTSSGVAIGIVACVLLKRYGLPLPTDVYYINALPVSMHGYEITTVFFAALAIALAATLYPAWMAARLRPVDGLRDAQR